MNTVNTRNVAILIFDDVEVLDFAGPFEVFNVAGEIIPFSPFPAFFTYTVGLTPQAVMTRGGMRVVPHYTLETLPQPDILVVPGGFGARRLVKNPALVAWVKDQAARVERLISVCTGALVLAQAGLLENLPATTHHTAFDLLKGICPSARIVTDQRYVQNGHIITSGGISAGVDTSLAVVEDLLGAEKAALVRAEMEWMWFTASAPALGS
jgi:transcriptional regulator GlxA family with amidase domain